MQEEVDEYKKGLSTEQIEERIKKGLINKDLTTPTKSIKAIIAGNFLTIFNLINLLLAIAIFCVGSYKNMTFLILVIINTAISTLQEIHSKKVIDKLSVVASTKVHVIRNGINEDIEINEVVLDEIVILETGNQIITDCIIKEGEIEVNESCITGEPEAIVKKVGDTILSGSYVVSGKCIAKVEHIGIDNYTSRISCEAKKIKPTKSEIMTSLNQIIKTVSIVIIPVGILLFCNQLRIEDNTIKFAIVNTVAAIIGMIPEGLVLLTSTVLAVSVIRLSKRKVLVQELYCIETLARVDVLCLDKTGTITSGNMELEKVVPIDGTIKQVERALTALGNYSQDKNGTIEAIREYYPQKIELTLVREVPFSSDKKWSGITFKEDGTYIIGAPEIILRQKYEKYKDIIEEYIKEYRVVVVTQSEEELDKKQLPEDVVLLGLILIKNQIRPQAKETLQYFKEQGVQIKLISGDNPVTVSKVAKQAGVENYQNYIDCTTLHSQEEIEQIVDKYTIFGRVSPVQKKEIMVALKKMGHTVAMTGDGVNDVIALKEADCSIAIAGGSDAARNVSQLVLLDSNFKSMPSIVAEGRRTINNIERSASLFLSKTIYATILAVFFLFASMPYPFMPVQLSLMALVCIGIPSFVLALEPNKERIKGRFISNVVSKSIPTAITTVINIILLVIISTKYNIPAEIYSTLCVILTVITGIALLIKISYPFNAIRITLIIAMIVLFVACFIILQDWFSVVIPKDYMVLIIALTIVAISNFIILNLMVHKILERNIKK